MYTHALELAETACNCVTTVTTAVHLTWKREELKLASKETWLPVTTSLRKGATYRYHSRRRFKPLRTELLSPQSQC